MAFRRKKKRSSEDYTTRNKVKLIRGGSDYFDLLIRMINEAAENIHFQTYIFDNDETGRRVAAALMRASRRGVKVRFLLDAYASQKLRGKFVDSLRQAGVQFRWFEPLLRSKKFYFGRRMHHKVLVVDTLYSLVGGVNISNKYNDIGEEPAWLDWAIHTVGEASVDLERVCRSMWIRSNWHLTRKKIVIPKVEIPPLPDENCRVRVRRNDWAYGRNQITRSYMQMMRRANSHIIFMSSYFMPSINFRQQMRRALKRGIKISVIVAGKSDIPIAKAAERYLYDWMFRQKIDIYEYKEGVLHGKVATCDGNWTTIGSYNINNLSAFASIELNLDVDDEEFALSAEKNFSKIMNDCCSYIDQKEYKQETTLVKRFFNWAAYNFLRVTLFIFTFYFKPARE